MGDDTTPDQVAANLKGADVLAVIVGSDNQPPLSAAISASAVPALAAIRRSSGNAAPRLVALASSEGPTPAAIIGLLSVLGNEAPDLKPLSLTLPIGMMSAKHWAENMVAALPKALAGCDESGEELLILDQVGNIRAPRITPLKLSLITSDGLGFKPGALDSVVWRDQRPPALLAPGAISVDVRAAGVNFRDIMFGLGILPEEAVEAGFAGATVGMEAAGIVRAVGPGVHRFKPGDRVVCVAPSCFGSTVTTLENAAARIPDDQDFRAAATLPIVALTAYYSLASLARLEPEDTVLIHGAVGGVGLAAIQYAQHVGAKIIATAGSPEKRALKTSRRRTHQRFTQPCLCR